jgi:2-oxoglutarate dehydrogenase E1 component
LKSEIIKMSDYSFITNAHPSFIESMYLKYKNAPESVEEGWQTFFSGFDYAEKGNGVATADFGGEIDPKELRVFNLIIGYRNRGHLLSDTNPIMARRDRRPKLRKRDFGLSDDDLNTVFQSGAEIGLQNATLQEIIDKLQEIYCGHIGFEYNHIQDSETRNWIRAYVENHQPKKDYNIPLEKKKRILQKLNESVVFEEFLGTKYVGQKRFSLEGGETTIVGLDGIINEAAEDDVEEIVIGMAHRGRLNVLANIMGKTYEQIFNEFEGAAIPDQIYGDGDVKYHLGFSAQVKTLKDRAMHLKLVPNPSHLESVNPVVEGFARAKADLLHAGDHKKILPILIHGDAAVAGLGITYETVQMSKLPGYRTGGTVHFVINNQIGFTTDFDDARSSTYSTAAANAIQAPVFHVNGDDPEAVLFAVEFAVKFRQKFQQDVFVDMVCYRKHGHNEGDDPQFTQPEMYNFIKTHPNPRRLYSETLIARGDLEKEMAEKLEGEFKGLLQNRLDEVREKPLPYTYQEPELAWKGLRFASHYQDFEFSPETGVKRQTIDKIVNWLMNAPEGFTLVPKMNRLFKAKQKLLDNNKLDWAMAELLTYGSILLQGKDVRLSGEDVKRGTFSHRHAVLTDAKTFKQINRLDGMDPKQGKFHIYNSLLSEFAVMGFEYGYAMASPDPLVIWEGQFGDFFNGAQTIVDQYIVAGESKWRRMNGLVLYLPHGYEGQGPEHSSARPERFLQSCAEFNMTVANVTTPANLFHLLRRQLERPFRKPLVIMTPKSLLRHPEVVSDFSDFETGNKFQEVIDDALVGTKEVKKIKRVLQCSGKIYYDLLARQREEKRDDIAIVRFEQLYPFPSKQVDDLKKKYKGIETYWVQEEPSNMGAWQYVNAFFLDHDFKLVARKSSASPATGFKKLHDKQQKDIVDRAFDVK